MGSIFTATFNFAEFRAIAPINEVNLWAFLLDRHGEHISVKRRKPALENLEKIFTTTFRLANEVGFREMTLRDLCRETGLSMGGLYGYIQSKDQLAEMIEDVIRHVGQALPTWVSHLALPLDRLEGMLRTHIYCSEILQPWFYFVYMESRVLQAEQRKTAKSAELHFQAQIADSIEETGLLPSEEAHLLAAHCLALVQDWHVKRWKYQAAKISVDAFADSAVRMVRTYLQSLPLLAGSRARRT
ncbi:MAG: TetR/AcrR family transcriptional regulator [Burkholderiales bacterium]